MALSRRRYNVAVVVWALVALMAVSSSVFAAQIGRIQVPGALPEAFDATIDILISHLSDPNALALYELGEEAFQVLDPAIFTGYSVKNSREAADFDPARTVRYGHASPFHLFELLAIMKHHGWNPSLNVESRVSSYVHHYEWGPLGEDDIYTPIDDERAIIYVMEYDAVFEFDNPEDVVAFNEFILQNAQKERGNETRFGLISDSWYVPLYSTTVPQDGYDALKEVRVTYGDHYFVNYVVADMAEEVAEALQALAGEGYTVSINDLWVNGVFFEYVGGTRD